MENVLVKKELEEISGGAHWIVIGAVVVGVVAFAVGVLDGYLRPYGCRR